MKRILLYFGEAPQKQQAVTQILEDMKLPYQVIQDDETTQTVRNLLQATPDASIKEAHPVAMDLMFLEEVSDEEILAFNQKAKENNCEMKQKAMLTKHNQHWRFYDLLLEIQKEHRYFQYVELIQQQLKDSQYLIIEEYSKESWSKYEAAFYHAYEIIQKESTLEAVEEAYQMLVVAKQRLQTKK